MVRLVSMPPSKPGDLPETKVGSLSAENRENAKYPHTFSNSSLSGLSRESACDATTRRENMSIATKRGDGGQTGLAGGIRVSKADLRVESYGSVDELNTVLGFARSICQNK